MSPADDLSAKLAADLETVERETTEIDLLVTQARTEADRHEEKRAAAADRMATTPPEERAALADQLLTLTRRAGLMASQVEVLEGKRKTMGRFRDALAGYVAAAAEAGSGGADAPKGGAGSALRGGVGAMPPELAGLVLGAQEDLRREIARAMHDGPAQSLTNIILQANIVERLLERDPAMASGEMRLLVAMVQQTLDATKSFIFDVRPMVLDDLGLMPTIRRAVRERSQRSGIPVAFESMGTDRRLPAELESAVFRILDLALVAFLAQRPERVAVKLDWAESLEARVWATRSTEAPARAATVPPVAEQAAGDVPPALAAMMEDRRRAERNAEESARQAAVVTLPDETWREIQGRATTVGIVAQLLDVGGDLRLIVDLPSV